MLAAGWGSPIPSAHFLSREPRAAPVLACFALQRSDGHHRRGPAFCLRATTQRRQPRKNCPLVANSLLVNAQAFDIRIASPSPADRAPSDAESQRQNRRAEEGQGRCRPPPFIRSAMAPARELALAKSRFPSFCWGRGDRWHSTDRCHSVLLSRDSKLPYKVHTLACNAVAELRPQMIWGQCNNHGLYPVYGSILHAAVCPDGVLLAPAAVLLLLATSASDDARNAGARRESRRACSSHQPVGDALSVIAPALPCRRGQVTTVICSLPHPECGFLGNPLGLLSLW